MYNADHTVCPTGPSLGEAKLVQPSKVSHVIYHIYRGKKEKPYVHVSYAEQAFDKVHLW